jgi:hypothetical protein
MARSGYEVRLDVLRLSKELADQTQAEKVSKAMCDASLHNTTYDIPEDNREDETLRIAEGFYSFVEDK